jgi:predicted transcriptional regulator
MTTKERTIEEIVKELNEAVTEFQFNDNYYRSKLLEVFTQTLQSERQKREEVVEEARRGERESILGKQSLPDQLRETRLKLGLSQQEVGKRLGYSAMAISHFEKGSRPIPDKVLGEFVMIFGSLVETKASNRRGKALTQPNNK